MKFVKGKYVCPKIQTFDLNGSVPLAAGSIKPGASDSGFGGGGEVPGSEGGLGAKSNNFWSEETEDN